MIPLPIASADETLPNDYGRGRPVKTTGSLCPVCLARIPADVFARDGQIWMDKTCPDHGPFSALLAADARHYYVADPRVAGLGSCCGSGRHCGDQFANHSCAMLIEITQQCNLTCPTCYADSSPQKNGFLSVDEFGALLDRLLAGGKGDANLLQLSGGEPTIHPQLFDLLDRALARGVKQVYVNTNGIRLAQRPFAERLAACGNRVSVYLQFDGLRSETHAALRGRAGLRDIKLQALDCCDEFGINVVPVMTVTRGVNEGELGDFLSEAVRWRAVRKVMVQPAMYSGRYTHSRRADRLTAADVARLVAEQTGGLFTEDDFTPIPCSDPNCFAMAVALRGPHKLVPVSRFLPHYQDWTVPGTMDLIAAVADTFDSGADLSRFLNRALASGGFDALDDPTVDELLGLLAGQSGWDRLFAIGVKPFMDAYTYDQDRIDKCCVHIVGWDGIPVSFCEYNAVNRPLGLL